MTGGDGLDAGTPRLLATHPVTHVRSTDAEAFHGIDVTGDPGRDDEAVGSGLHPEPGERNAAGQDPASVRTVTERKVTGRATHERAAPFESAS